MPQDRIRVAPNTVAYADTWIMHTTSVPSAGPTRLMLAVVE